MSFKCPPYGVIAVIAWGEEGWATYRRQVLAAGFDDPGPDFEQPPVAPVGFVCGIALTVAVIAFHGVDHESVSGLEGTDPDGLWIINGTLGLSSPLRIELYSNNPLDDGLQVDYEYMRQS